MSNFFDIPMEAFPKCRTTHCLMKAALRTFERLHPHLIGTTDPKAIEDLFNAISYSWRILLWHFKKCAKKLDAWTTLQNTVAGTDTDLTPVATVLRNIDLTKPKPPSGTPDEEDDDEEEEKEKEDEKSVDERPQRSPPKWRDWGAMADMAPTNVFWEVCLGRCLYVELPMNLAFQSQLIGCPICVQIMSTVMSTSCPVESQSDVWGLVSPNSFHFCSDARPTCPQHDS